MKGLLLKDFYQITKNFKLYGVLILLFAALSIWGHMQKILGLALAFETSKPTPSDRLPPRKSNHHT